MKRLRRLFREPRISPFFRAILETTRKKFSEYDLSYYINAHDGDIILNAAG